MNLFIRTLSIVACLYSCSSIWAEELTDVAETQESTVQQEENKMSEATQVAAKHILVSTEEKANEILAKIQNNEKTLIQNNEKTFEDAAKEFSNCPSRSNGGDLGFFGKNMMVKEFEEAAFSLNVGEISKPVKTQFGWHLIKVYDRK